MPLLAYVDKAVARAYGVLGAFGLRRSVFVVDPEGLVAWRWVGTMNVTFPDVGEVREALAAV